VGRGQGADPDDLGNGEFDPQDLINRIAAKVQEAADAVEAKITEIVNNLP